MRKNLLKLLFCLSIFSVSIWACKKDNNFSTHQEIKLFNKNQAKVWFESKYPNLDASEQAKSPISYTKNIDWKNAIISTIGDDQIVEAPITFKQKKVLTIGTGLTTVDEIASAILTKIIFTKRSDGNITSAVMSIIPEKNYLISYNSDLSNNYY